MLPRVKRVACIYRKVAWLFYLPIIPCRPCYISYVIIECTQTTACDAHRYHSCVTVSPTADRGKRTGGRHHHRGCRCNAFTAKTRGHGYWCLPGSAETRATTLKLAARVEACRFMDKHAATQWGGHSGVDPMSVTISEENRTHFLMTTAGCHSEQSVGADGRQDSPGYPVDAEGGSSSMGMHSYRRTHSVYDLAITGFDNKGRFQLLSRYFFGVRFAYWWEKQLLMIQMRKRMTLVSLKQWFAHRKISPNEKLQKLRWKKSVISYRKHWKK